MVSLMTSTRARKCGEIRAEGKGSLMYQVAGSYYLPWDKLALYPELTGQEKRQIDLSYDRTELAVNDTVRYGSMLA
jgi:hypothetical protein